MEEAGAGNIGYRRSNLLPGVDHVHAERIHSITPKTQGRKIERGEEVEIIVYNSVTSCESTPAV